ncbi:flagellar protein FlgN [Lentibacillus salicampi]|uniref:Flagellar protein FlgN n=1 Tax=Lentibacillus salicampi TaxID=175306 RepID=A0A4Y9AFY4_9BACI|nr:flagellar protein FlgN [Lentibacillus salicampi]TFJ93301.1 flagellar protein FlgN [Lentibacillus salicampi]
MSVQPIIQSLEKLISLHKGLFDLSKQKTGIVKDGSVDKLQSLLVNERKYVQAVEQAEADRQKNVREWAASRGLDFNNATITGILGTLSDEKVKEKLERTAINLTHLMTQLKQQEQLNQGLIKQSMQFVDLSLNMMTPSLKHMNYGGKKSAGSPERSVFDSKA